MFTILYHIRDKEYYQVVDIAYLSEQRSYNPPRSVNKYLNLERINSFKKVYGSIEFTKKIKILVLLPVFIFKKKHL